MKTKKHVPWNKGKHFIKKHKVKHSEGYWLIWVGNHPYQNNDEYVPEHRLVMEKHLGRYINPRLEHVHHKDQDKTNNLLSNLELVTPQQHRRIHSNWKEINGRWYKICKSCNQELEVSLENFYKRKSGDLEFFHVCINCARKKALAYFKTRNGVERQRQRRLKNKQCYN